MNASLPVFVVDDDADLRQALRRLLEGESLAVQCFAGADAFLQAVPADAAGCAVLDIEMPGLDGTALQRLLAERRSSIAVVFLTGRGDIPASVRAIKAGAVDFLTKPVKRVDLLRAVHAGLAQSAAARASGRATADLQARLQQLSPRERQVFEEVIAGRLNKVIADRLGTSEQTIKVHRGRLMDKLGAGSVAELVRLALQLGVPPAP